LPTPFVFTELSNAGVVQQQTGGLSADNGTTPNLAGLDRAKVQAENGHAFTVPAVGRVSDFRVRAMLNTDGSGINTVAVSLQSVDATMSRMESLSWLVAGGVLIALTALAAVTVRFGLRPLRVVEDTAEEIAAGDLSRRIPAGRAGTEIGRAGGTGRRQAEPGRTVSSISLLSSTSGSSTTFPVTVALAAGSPNRPVGTGAGVTITTATATDVPTVPNPAITPRPPGDIPSPSTRTARQPQSR
jgi:HAMP domain-containing protein